MKKIAILTCVVSFLLIASNSIYAQPSARQGAASPNTSASNVQSQRPTGARNAVTAASTPATKRNLATDGIFKRQTIATKEPLPFPQIREADVVWSKRIWRVVDLREKLNHPLYYPTVEMMLRKSLVQTLVEAVRSGEIRAFDPDQDDEFTTLLTPEELSRNFDAVDRTERRQKMDGSGDTTILIRGAYNWDEVRELIVKEDWFFDKHYSKMFVRIVGICPVRVYKKTLNVVGNEEEEDDGDVQKKQLFWVNYDESRPVLARTPSYNPSNDAVNLSYDDIFTMRRFSSYIQKESNPHNNRSVSSYTPNGYAAFLESERIKNSIFTWEHDLWEY